MYPSTDKLHTTGFELRAKLHIGIYSTHEIYRRPHKWTNWIDFLFFASIHLRIAFCAHLSDCPLSADAICRDETWNKKKEKNNGQRWHGVVVCCNTLSNSIQRNTCSCSNEQDAINNLFTVVDNIELQNVKSWAASEWWRAMACIYPIVRVVYMFDNINWFKIEYWTVRHGRKAQLQHKQERKNETKHFTKFRLNEYWFCIWSKFLFSNWRIAFPHECRNLLEHIDEPRDFSFTEEIAKIFPFIHSFAFIFVDSIIYQRNGASIVYVMVPAHSARRTRIWWTRSAPSPTYTQCQATFRMSMSRQRENSDRRNGSDRPNWF